MKFTFYTLVFILTVSSCSNNNASFFNIVFDKVDGISTDSKVYLNGVEVGNVKSLELINYKVLVKLRLKNIIQLPRNSKFIIKNNLLSNPAIFIEPSKDLNFISTKDTVVGIFEDKKLLDNLISDTNNQKKFDTALKKIIKGLDSVLKEKK